MKRLIMTPILSIWYFIHMCDRTFQIANAANHNQLNVEETYEAIRKTVARLQEKKGLKRHAGSDFTAAVAHGKLAHENP